MRDDGRLLARGRRGLRVRRVGHVAEREDVRVAAVAQRRRIDIDPAGGVGERARAHEIGCLLRRHDVDHVERADDRFAAAVGQCAHERRAARGAVDRDEVVAERQRDPVALHVRHQRGHVVGDAEQRVAGIEELDVGGAEAPHAQPVIAGQIHGLLRRARALDRHRRLREQRIAAAKCLHELPRVRREIVAVVRRDAVAAERVGKTVDRLPVELEPRTDDEFAVADAPAIVEHDRMRVGFERGDRRTEALHAARQHVGDRARSRAGLENARADHRPARLVVVDVGRIDDRDVERALAREQARGDRDARRTGADDHDFVARVGRVRRVCASACKPRRERREIVAGRGGRRDDVVGAHAACLRQRP